MVAPVNETEVVVAALLEAGCEGAEAFGTFYSTKHEQQFGVQLHLDEVAASPVLVNILPSLNQPSAIEAVARHLKGASSHQSAFEPLVEAFRRLAPQSPAWVIGDSLASLARPVHVDVVLELSLDRRYGQARQMIVASLWRYRKDERIESALVALSPDPDVTVHAMSALRRAVGNDRALPTLRSLVDGSTDEPVRRQAALQVRKAEAAIARRTDQG
jgi:hypothetical protein